MDKRKRPMSRFSDKQWLFLLLQRGSDFKIYGTISYCMMSKIDFMTVAKWVGYHLENISRHGLLELILADSVDALKSLGFRRSAAYEALSANGQFSAWLRFTLDGIIIWMDGHGK